MRRASNTIPTAGFIAHRGGARLAPENTLSAVRKALALNCPYIELDIQRSADNVLLLMHDTSVDRTTGGTGKVNTLTWAAIQTLDAGSSFSAEFAGEPVPSLEEVLDLLKNTGTIPVLEVKNPELYPGIAEQLVRLIRQREMTRQVMIISFNHQWLSHFSSCAPEIETGSLWWYPLLMAGHPTEARVISTFWLSVLIDPTLTRRLHQQGYEVWVWTVDSAFLIRLLLALGVDQVTTNRPNLWAAMFK